MFKLLIRRVCLSYMILLVVAEIPVEASQLQYRVGIGYEFISQEFFLDSIFAGDSLAASAALKTTYLDDYKGLISLRYNPFQNNRLELQGSYEQTPDFIRGKFLAGFKSISDRSRIDINGRLDIREKYKGSPVAGDSYVVGESRINLKFPVNDRFSWTGLLHGDFVTFDSTDDFSLGYYRLGGKFGISRSFESFSQLDANLFLNGRSVPDSLQLNYLSFGTNLIYFGLFESGSLDLLARVERRDYNMVGREDDYLRFDSDIRLNLRLSERMLFRQEFDGELANFDEADIVNFNFSRARLALLAGFQNGALTILFGPQMEIKEESAENFAQAEDYFELGLKVDFDIFTIGGLLGSIESVTGQRNLADQIELQSDFRFQRLLAIGDIRILGELHFNSLISAEWEWHDQSEENNQIFLLSSNLTWGF